MSGYQLSDSIEGGGLVFVSGQTAYPTLGPLDDQLRTAYRKVAEILAGHGLTLADVVDETVYVADSNLWSVVALVRDEVYRDRFPASTLVQVAGFPHDDIRCEVKVVAVTR